MQRTPDARYINKSALILLMSNTPHIMAVHAIMNSVKAVKTAPMPLSCYDREIAPVAPAASATKQGKKKPWWETEQGAEQLASVQV